MRGYIAMATLFINIKLIIWLISKGTTTAAVAAVLLFWMVPVMPYLVTRNMGNIDKS